MRTAAPHASRPHTMIAVRERAPTDGLSLPKAKRVASEALLHHVETEVRALRASSPAHLAEGECGAIELSNICIDPVLAETCPAGSRPKNSAPPRQMAPGPLSNTHFLAWEPSGGEL